MTSQPPSSASRPPTSHQNGLKRHTSFDESRYEDPNYVSLPSNDMNAWYYPSHGHDSDVEDDDIRFHPAVGNWGRKSAKEARWIRRGKQVPWGPGIEEWQIEEHARKRIKLMLPPHTDEDEPITLPHLRSPSPPITAPYPAPEMQHTTYTSFVMDPSVTHTFRSCLLDELECATNNLIEGETSLRRALGRLIQVLHEDPDRENNGEDVVPKREDEGDGEEDDPEVQRLSRAPDLTPAIYKIFLDNVPNMTAPIHDSRQQSREEAAFTNLEKSLGALRELHDDGREYIERLEEIREYIGYSRIQRNAIWDMVREKALKELQKTAYVAAG
ncbi:hypothetical protein QCA50_001551 [Cerrena zonata]|uniref:Transcriptional regulatory protein RXT2 N-terminal domain-containing protein n=1 Tax=Cerrena zonata TaxID=2478898 RepID=A0AAW0GMC0_9APHY